MISHILFEKASSEKILVKRSQDDMQLKEKNTGKLKIAGGSVGLVAGMV